MDEEIEAFIAALENSTRREILRRLTIEESYAMELSRVIGVSQQAVIKHLSLLEQARLISSVGLIPSSSGASRRMYRPQGFSTLIIDYAQNFFDVIRKDIDFDDQMSETTTEDHAKMISDLISVDRELDNVLETRTRLLKRKDSLIRKIRDSYLHTIDDSMTRDVVNNYIETLDVRKTAERSKLPAFLVEHLLSEEGIPVPEES